jgi:hypothetical protein
MIYINPASLITGFMIGFLVTSLFIVFLSMGLDEDTFNCGPKCPKDNYRTIVEAVDLAKVSIAKSNAIVCLKTGERINAEDVRNSADIEVVRMECGGRICSNNLRVENDSLFASNDAKFRMSITCTASPVSYCVLTATDYDSDD